MKKTITLSLIILGLAAVSPDVQAYAEVQDGDDCRVADSLCNYNDSQRKLNRAIQLRNRYNLYNHRINNLGHKNIYAQRERHVLGRKLINVNEVKTDLSREGELEADTYVDRKPKADQRFSVSNNPKQNWRRAAIDYYVDGGSGYTNRIGMHQGVKYGSTHRVNRIPSFQFTRGELSKRGIRDEQKYLASVDDNKVNKVATGKQKVSKRMGTRGNTYTSPFQRYEVYDQYPRYLRTLRSLLDEYTTDEEKLERLYTSPEADFELTDEEVKFEVEDSMEDQLSPYETEDEE